MGLFGPKKKKVCSFCGGKAGFLSSTELTDGERICGTCTEKGTSAFVDLTRLDKAGVEKHIAYMGAMGGFGEQALAVVQGKPYPGHDRYYSRDSLTLYDDLGMFSVENRGTPRPVRELFRYDQIAAYKPLTANPMLSSSDSYALRRVGLQIALKGHPWVSRLELLFAERVQERELESVLGDLERLTDRLDQMLGIPQVAGLASSVAGAFGVRTDIERVVGAQQAEVVARWAKVADEAWGRFT